MLRVRVNSLCIIHSCSPACVRARAAWSVRGARKVDNRTADQTVYIESRYAHGFALHCSLVHACVRVCVTTSKLGSAAHREVESGELGWKKLLKLLQIQ